MQKLFFLINKREIIISSFEEKKFYGAVYYDYLITKKIDIKSTD